MRIDTVLIRRLETQVEALQAQLAALEKRLDAHINEVKWDGFIGPKPSYTPKAPGDEESIEEIRCALRKEAGK